jgi:uncharacterized membrane protein YphA (DoxX/SURF4 family)
MRAAVYLYGLASIGTGIMNLVWADFEPDEEPIQAFGDHVPGREIFAYIVAALLVVGGIAILFRRSARFGAVVLAVVYLIFTVFWLPRLYTAPRILGFRFPVYIGVLDGVCQQLILVAAAALVYAPRLPRRSQLSDAMTLAARWIFGLSAIDFGLSHLTDIAAAARLVPTWIPLGQNFWVVLTGTAFVLAGIAILSGALDVLASRLLALMLLVFSALALAPLILKYPHSHSSWGVNIYNLAAIGAVWVLAEWLASRRQPKVSSR